MYFLTSFGNKHAGADAGSILSGVGSDIQTLRFAFNSESPKPYILSHTEGIEIEIVDAIFKSVNVQMFPVLLPTNRVLNYQFFDVDGRGNILVNGSVDEKKYVSNEYIQFNNLAFSFKELKINKVEDLFNYRQIIWEGAVDQLGADYKRIYNELSIKDQNNRIIKQNNSLSRLKLLFKDRGDLLLIDIFVFSFYLKKLKLSPEKLNHIRSYKAWLKPVSSRASFKTRKHRDLFNKGLKAIKANGLYEKILSKYRHQNIW